MKPRTTGQHVLPRLLLNGFVAFTKKKQRYTYLFRAGATEGIPTNIKDAAKRRLFYGAPEETGIEDALAKEENKYAPAVERTRQSRSIDAADLETILELVVNLSIRTHHLRSGMAVEAERVFATAQTVLSGVQAAEMAYRVLKDDPDILRNAIRGAIQEIPFFPRDPGLHLWLDRTLELYVLKYVEGQKIPLGHQMEELLVAMAKHLNWAQIAESSHIQVLQKELAPRARIEVCRSFTWSVIQTPHHSLILGDFGPLGISDETGEYRPLSVLGKEVAGILQPITHDLLIVGYSGDVPDVDVENLRQATAAMSTEFIVAAQDSQEIRNLVPLIGSSRALLTDAELDYVKESFQPNKEHHAETRLPLDHGITFAITGDGSPNDQGKAEAELVFLTQVLQNAIEETGLPIETQIRFLLTADLQGSVASVSHGYGYSAELRGEGRAVPIYGKTLYLDSHPPLVGTIIILTDLWENDSPGLVAARYQLVFSQVMQTIITGRRIVEGSGRLLPSAPSFQDELRVKAEGMLDVHDAHHNALPFLSPLVSATDENGDPAGPGDILAIAYVGFTRGLLHRLGTIARDQVQAYRESHAELDEILPAVWLVLDELLLVFAHMVGLSSTRMVERLRIALLDLPGYKEYFEEDWNGLVAAFREQNRKDAQESLIMVMRGILARMGLYLDDRKGGQRDIIVGKPRLLGDLIDES